MPSIITQVSQTAVNYQKTFTYTIDASFNGIQGSISSAKIQDFIPETIQFTLPPIHSPLKGITTQAVSGGTWIVFDFGAIADLGVAVNLSLACRFKLSGTKGETFINNPQLWINGMLQSQAEAEVVTLVLDPNFLVTHKLVVPAIPPTSGGGIILAVNLKNNRDLGARIDHAQIEITLPEGCVFDKQFPVQGKDLSESYFSDKSQDNLEGVLTENVLKFNLSSYKGTNYQFFYKVLIGSSLSIGSELIFPLVWGADEINTTHSDYQVGLKKPTYHGSVSKYGAEYTLAEERINYEMYLNNDGNMELKEAILTDILPVQVDFYRFQTGTFWVKAIKTYVNATYTIRYTTAKGLTGLLGTFNTNVNSTVDLSMLNLAEGDRLMSLTWQLGNWGIGMQQNIAPKIDGIVRQYVTMGTSILNHFELEWQTLEGTDRSISNKVTVVQNLCVCQPMFAQVSPNTSVKPGDTIRYRVGANCWNSRLENPVVAIMLPDKLQYMGNVSAVYSDYFSNTQVQQVVPAQVISNFSGTGKTLVKFIYKGSYALKCRQRGSLTITFDTKVVVGAKGTISTFMLLGNAEGTQVIPNNLSIYQDTQDLAGNGSSLQLYAQSAVITNQIIFFTSIASNKKVKGALDESYTEEPAVGKTYEGGKIDYVLSVTNTGNVDLEGIEIVDILPHIGDKGVIERNSRRNSEFVVYNINQIMVNITPSQGVKPTFEVLYSRSYDPVRFGNTFQEIGTVDDWHPKMPEITTEVRSFKVRLNDTKIVPGQTLEIHVKGLAPMGIETEKVAWNSFAAKVSYKDLNGQLKYLLPVEPEKVGVEVVAIPSNRRKLSGRVWQDTNSSGIYEEGESGIDDVVVLLYNSSGKAIQATVTTPNGNGEPGYYMFNYLLPGEYVVRVIREELKYKFTTQQLEVLHGSKIDSRIGITPIIDLTIQASKGYVDVGLILLTPDDRVTLALAMNQSAQKTVRGAIYNQLLLGMKLEDTKSLIQ